MAGLPTNAPAKTDLINSTFVFKQGDDTKTGKLTLQKFVGDIESVDDPQAFLNEIADTQGTSEGDATRKQYATNNVIADGDSQKAAIEKFDVQVQTNINNIVTNQTNIAANLVLITNNTRTTFANEAIAASGEITKSDVLLDQIRRVSGDSAPQTSSTTPFGDCTNTVDGVTITLRGTDATNTVTIENNDIQFGCILNGNAELGIYAQIVLMYDAVLERWIEQQRNF